jgi:hypothetical protein
LIDAGRSSKVGVFFMSAVEEEPPTRRKEGFRSRWNHAPFLRMRVDSRSIADLVKREPDRRLARGAD